MKGLGLLGDLVEMAAPNVGQHSVTVPDKISKV